MLSLGVDIKWNGWVGAPPTAGYEIQHGSLADIVDAPKELLDEMNRSKNGNTTDYEVSYEEGQTLELARPFNPSQLKDLKKKLEWMQTNGDLSYAEWRDGIFALKAGVSDPELLAELVEMWTYNRNYQAGDEVKAQEILERADKYGGVGPGTVFGIIKQVAMRQGATAPSVELSPQEVIDRSGIHVSVKDDGSLSCAPSETNVASLIGAMFPADQLHYDTRTDRYVFKGEEGADKDIVNQLTPMIQSRQHGLGFDKIKKATITGGLEVLMASRRRDPHVEWLKTIKWDGEDRIHRFFPDYVGSEDDEYTQAVGKNFWIALAARGLKKGIKFDHIVVIEGTEGIRKSSLIEAIGGQYTFAPSTRKSLEDMDDLRKMHQAIVVELPELMGLVGEDPNKVKAFLSKSYDNIRGLYERIAARKDRGFVFIGTTNDSRYLSIDMGARRFWPIRVVRQGHIDTNRLEMDREQLFAEAVHRFQNREKFYEVPIPHLNGLIKDRIKEDPLVEPIKSLIRDSENIVVSDIYSRLSINGLMARGLNEAASKRIKYSLRALGYEESMKGIWNKKIIELNTFL